MACFLANGMLSVMSTGFNKKILDFDTNSTRKPLQMVWCGEDSVLLTWQGFLLMVGPFGHWLQFPYSGVAHHVIPESDCVRILTRSTCEILQRVPQATDNIRRIFSTDPAAMLFDAMERYYHILFCFFLTNTFVSCSPIHQYAFFFFWMWVYGSRESEFLLITCLFLGSRMVMSKRTIVSSLSSKREPLHLQ
jgi:hypothetical protein